ncbi:MAG: HAMP domain-containing histidine kinase [Polyangiaceae bacterium]|nr:HAMP domain-containing histidine kinase [Polyangiaceae bacterium]
MKPPAKALGLEWLVRLRWVMILVQAAMLAAAKFSFDLPYAAEPLAGIVAGSALSNGLLELWQRRGIRAERSVVGGVLVLDAILLTVLLWLSGGPTNPFSVFYLVHVALAALLLEVRWVWAVALLTSCGFGSLFLLTPEEAMHRMHQGGGMRLHLQGMWVSYAAAAALVGYFVSKVSRALSQRDAELLRMQEAVARNEKLLSLSTLAAGAAHELGTPLGTIAIIASELERAAAGPLDAAAVLDDARMLRAEATRCRDILAKMAAHAGQSPGEMLRPVKLADIASDVRKAVADGARMEVEAEAATVNVPRDALVQSLVNLVNNGLEAGEGRPVSLRLAVADRSLHCAVEDRGSGMPDDVLARLGEPFFTTKPKGMGLGVFLVRALADRLGGRFDVRSSRGQGTTITITIPAEPVEAT